MKAINALQLDFHGAKEKSLVFLCQLAERSWNKVIFPPGIRIRANKRNRISFVTYSLQTRRGTCSYRFSCLFQNTVRILAFGVRHTDLG